MLKQIPYGTANYVELIEKNCYFVDKTSYVELLERVSNPIYLRPRKFGKSLWCRILECYYNINQKNEFDYLFGETYIGQNPTGKQNSYIVLHLDFSTVDPTGTIDKIEENFNYICNLRLQLPIGHVEDRLKKPLIVDEQKTVAANLEALLLAIQQQNLPQLYVIIDEYDNFANQLVKANKDTLYQKLMADDGFFKTFFKTLKEGRKTGAIANVFITGVLPITMDDLASGFNVGTYITLDPDFEAMLGFTQPEVDLLLDQIYEDYQIDRTSYDEVKTVIKNHYDGYQFVKYSQTSIYNSTILMFFLDKFCRYKTIPEHLTDLNLKTDLAWVRRLTASNPQKTEAFVNQLTLHNTISYNDILLVEKFNMHQFFEESYFPISFFYLGMLTRHDHFNLRLPNLNIHNIFVEYFNEIYHVDVATRYAELMQTFINQPDLEYLFAGYWEKYISQLPEAIFQQVNENFYRTTFFDLCRQFLSHWFTWNVERSYPQGKSDLEFVGKFHEKYAGLRWVIEFKYYSNVSLKKLKTTIADFTLQDGDTTQIAGYVEGLLEEYPQADVRQFVIYCFGNQGFRVFEVTNNG
ncbi:AAA family ATPase [Anaerolineales bacterium HSG25]|nr:AAA family ATPase [Anaerolineales bacterium HSG25]